MSPTRSHQPLLPWIKRLSAAPGAYVRARPGDAVLATEEEVVADSLRLKVSTMVDPLGRDDFAHGHPLDTASGSTQRTRGGWIDTALMVFGLTVVGLGLLGVVVLLAHDPIGFWAWLRWLAIYG